MILKKFYGNNIKAAREKAFDQLGTDCIVLESKNASGDKKACVTVMLDNKKEEVLKDPAKKKGTAANNGTYSRKDLIPQSLDKVKDAVAEGFDQFSSEMGFNGNGSGKPVQSDAREKSEETLTMSRRSTPVYDRKKSRNGKSSDFQKEFFDNLEESPVSKEVKALHRRFDQMEKLMSEALVSANIRYISHPAFQQLLNAGMQAATISKWFEQILNKGIDPYEQSQSFMYELANIVRSALSFALPEAPEKNMLFVGPSGSGKTSMIMKLATNPEFMKNKSVALVSIEPKSNFKQYSPLKLFAEDMELPFYRVRAGVEMSSLLPDLEKFDHVLFDSSSISLQQETAFRDFWKIRQILSPVTPLEVHYVVNATLERYYFKESYAANHPMQPDYVAISHLDETEKWGHLIPFINRLGAGVRYVSRGPNVPNNLQMFKPEWFAEKILSES
jgi:flagellar biosynthesis GTPase FlhF